MKSNRCGESGYVLLAVMLAVTLILVAMSIELPRIAQQIKREKEEELVHRGKDYATAVKRFVHKNGGRYPLSVEQLEDTNHIRFLRKRYKDPITGEADWKMVHVGEAQVKLPTTNPGLSGPGGTNPGLFGTNPPSGTNPPGTPTPTGTTQLNNPGGPTFGQPQPTQGGTGNLGSLTTSNIGSGQTVGGGQIIGVASVSKKQSIKEFNDKDHYDEWYFVYDLRLEQSGGTGITVAEPRIGGSSSTTGGGSSTTSGSSSTTGAGSTTGTSGTQPPPAGTDSGQPQPTGTPQPPPQVPN